MGVTVRMMAMGGLCLLVLWAGCAQEAPEEAAVIRPVRYETVFASGGDRVRSFTGVAKAGLLSNLSFRVGGTLTHLGVRVGDDVTQGTLVARLDDSDYRLQVQETEAGLEQARAQELNARASYQRIRALYENNNAAKSELDSARATFDSAKASVRSLRKRLELARLQVSYTRLTAPFSGAVSVVPVEVNENVSPGQTVVVLTTRSQPEVSVAIPEMLIANIKKEDAVSATFDALSGETFSGVVTEVGVTASEFATTYPVTIQLTDSHPGIKPGMAATVDFRIRSSREVRIYVPSHAVGEDQNGRFAYVVLPENGQLAKVRRVAVRTGEMASEGLEILAGLSEGDLLVTAGVSRLQDGMSVKLLDND